MIKKIIFCVILMYHPYNKATSNKKCGDKKITNKQKLRSFSTELIIIYV